MTHRVKIDDGPCERLSERRGCHGCPRSDAFVLDGPLHGVSGALSSYAHVPTTVGAATPATCWDEFWPWYVTGVLGHVLNEHGHHSILDGRRRHGRSGVGEAAPGGSGCTRVAPRAGA